VRNSVVLAIAFGPDAIAPSPAGAITSSPEHASGGIGVVEGIPSLLLISCHFPAVAAIAGVMLDRIISFWILLAIGWGVAAAGLVVMTQHRRGGAGMRLGQMALRRARATSR
jgi:hypothetical protein